MKRLRFLGGSYKDLLNFPRDARKVAGFELLQVQQGAQPKDFKPMRAIGPGVEELRVWVEAGTFRVIYLARFEDAVYVLHAFEKKSQKTMQTDLNIARERYKQLLHQ